MSSQVRNHCWLLHLDNDGTELTFTFVPEQVLAANIVAVAWNTYLSNASHSAVASQPEDLI